MLEIAKVIDQNRDKSVGDLLRKYTQDFAKQPREQPSSVPDSAQTRKRTAYRKSLNQAISR